MNYETNSQRIKLAVKNRTNRAYANKSMMTKPENLTFGDSSQIKSILSHPELASSPSTNKNRRFSLDPIGKNDKLLY